MCAERRVSELSIPTLVSDRYHSLQENKIRIIVICGEAILALLSLERCCKDMLQGSTACSHSWIRIKRFACWCFSIILLCSIVNTHDRVMWESSLWPFPAFASGVRFFINDIFRDSQLLTIWGNSQPTPMAKTVNRIWNVRSLNTCLSGSPQWSLPRCASAI